MVYGENMPISDLGLVSNESYEKFSIYRVTQVKPDFLKLLVHFYSFSWVKNQIESFNGTI